MSAKSSHPKRFVLSVLPVAVLCSLLAVAVADAGGKIRYKPSATKNGCSLRALPPQPQNGVIRGKIRLRNCGRVNVHVWLAFNNGRKYVELGETFLNYAKPDEDAVYFSLPYQRGCGRTVTAYRITKPSESEGPIFRGNSLYEPCK